MATVDKNFRIKNGLVVEGSTGTINGQNILTETGSDQYILDLVGGENLIDSVASGLSVDGSSQLSIDRTVVDGWYDANGAAATAQSNAEDYADGLASNYEVSGAVSTHSDLTTGVHGVTGNVVGTSDMQFLTNKSLHDPEVTSLRVADSSIEIKTSATADFATDLTITSPTANRTITLPDATGTVALTGDITSAIDALDTDDIEEGSTNQYFTSQRALDATSSAYDPAGSAATAQSNAEDYADGLASNYDPAGSAATAQSAAEGYTDSLIGDLTVDGTPGNTITNRIATAVSNLVDSAPATLDTLNELAAALQDNPDIISDLQDIAAGKQDTLTAGSNIDITSNTISVTGLTTDDVSEGSNKYATAENIIDELNDYGVIDLGFVDIDISGAVSAAQINSSSIWNSDGSIIRSAVSNSISTAGSATSVVQFVGSVGTAVKYLIKLNTNSHSHVWEALATVDGSNNIAVTEYAEVTTNGSLGSAAYSLDSDGKGGYTLNLAITSTYNNTSYKVIAEQF
jgi:hypothetical protein